MKPSATPEVLLLMVPSVTLKMPMAKGNDDKGAEPGVQMLVVAGHCAAADEADSQPANTINKGARRPNRRCCVIKSTVGREFTALNVARKSKA
ncbi:hypothetical protein GCM10028821_39820 [Hymenobacter jeollabukensis]